MAGMSRATIQPHRAENSSRLIPDTLHMTQFFEVRVRIENPGDAILTEEEVNEQMGYLVEAPMIVVSVTEDVQARGMGEATPASGDDDA